MSSDTHTTGDGAQYEDAPANVLNEDALVGLAEDEEELSWRYKTALAPHNYNTEPADHVVVDEDYYSQTLVVRDWPDRPVYGFLDNLISFTMPSVETTVTTHFTGEDDRDAERELSNAAGSVKDMVRDYAASKWIPEYFVEKAAEMYGSIKRTQKTVRQSEYGLYTSQTYIEVRAPSLDHLDTAVSLIRSKMQNVNADAVPLKYDHDLGYQTTAPACKDYIGGETKMVGDGLSRLVPWTAQNLIEPGGIELGINEDTGDPIILDLWNRETGFNIGIWGTIGGGKTTTMTRVLTRSKMQYPEIPQVIIDPRQEFDGYAEAFGGKRLVIGSETGINPFMIEPISAEKRDELGEKAPLRKAKRRGMRFLESYYNFMGLPFEDKQGLWRDVVDVGFERRGITEDPATHHYDNPTLADDFIPILDEAANSPQKFLRESLKDSDYAKGRVEKLATRILQNDVNALEEGGEFEHLAKATTVDITDIDVLVLDLQNYENDAAAGLVMEPLLVAILEQAKSSDEPMQLGIDEFHYMFHNTTSIETLKRAYRYSRHSTLSVITSTQTVSEFYTENESGVKQLTDSAKELISMMSVKIFHYSDEMDKELAGEFDMSDAEYSYHKDASTGDPTAQALLQVEKEGSFKLDVDFDDEMNPREFALNQYDPTDDGYDLYEYLADYTDADDRDPCEWTWEIPIDDAGETGQSVDRAEGGQVSEKGQLDDYSSPSPDLSSEADETPETETKAKADVETETGANTDTDKDKDEDEEAESNIKSATEVIEATSPDEEQSDGLAARLKQSVTGGKDTDGDTDNDELSLTALGAVTARTAGDLQDAGFESVEQVYEADESALVEVDGFDEQKADTIQAEAAEALGLAEDESDTDSADTGSEPDAETDNSADRETDSDERTTEQEADESTDDSPTLEVEFTPGEESSTDSEDDADPDPDADTSDSADSAGIAGRMKDSLGSMFSHPAAGKSQPDLTDIGLIDDRKAAALRAAGYETVEAIYTADKTALAAVEGIDATNASYLQKRAEYALDASDAPVPERPAESEADAADEDGSETDESTDQPVEDPQPPDAESADADETAVESNGDEPAQPALTDIREVGDDRADDLREAGYESVEAVAQVEQGTLTEVEGIGGKRAETISASATDLLDGQTDSAVANVPGDDD